MKLLFKNLLIFMTYGSLSIATAQNADKTQITFKSNGISIPPLQTMIDSAINHNAMLSYRNLEIGAKESNLKSKKHNWLRNFGVQADGRYGNFNNNSINVIEGDQNFQTTSTTQLNYTIGVYAKFPIFDGINRRNEIKKGKIEIAQAKSLAEAQKDELRQIVIKQYQELTLKQKLLNISSQNLGNAKVNMKMAEKEFRSGVIPIYEYVRISDMTSRIESDYEKSKSEFLLAKKIMENLVGFKIIQNSTN